MTELRLYDTLTRQTVAFVPATAGRAGVYCCGPTVYDLPHAGHARAALAPDLLVRRLRARGLSVKYVRNYTDVDDRILARARDNGETPVELSRRMIEAYRAGMSAINCVAPDVEPKVSEHIPQIVALVERLVARERAYVQPMPGGTTDVYFAVRSFEGYGKLSRRKIDELLAGARVEKDETKRDPLDFALWKGAERSEWGWESPWGWGRPGWHIECSAMCHEHLGHGFDVHTGGMDLIFPHHENEIAQSEGAYEGQYARHWLHNGFVNVDAEKMSKSLGNFVTLGDVLERNDPEGFRWFLLGVHYRGPIQFETEQLSGGRVVFPGVIEGEKRVDYLYATLGRLTTLTDAAVTVPAKATPEHQKLRDAARAALDAGEAALDDDLNTPVALAALGELLKLANELADGAEKRRKDAAFQGSAAILARELQLHFDALGQQLGLGRAPLAEYLRRTRARRLRVRGLEESWVEEQIAARRAARENKDFKRSDELRDALAAKGIVVKDTPLGVVWSVEP